MLLSAATLALAAPIAGQLYYARDFTPGERGLKHGDHIFIEATLSYHARPGDVHDGDGGSVLDIRIKDESVLTAMATITIGNDPRVDVYINRWGSPAYYQTLRPGTISGTLTVIAYQPFRSASVMINLASQDGRDKHNVRIDALLSDPWVKTSLTTEGWNARAKGVTWGDLSGLWTVEEQFMAKYGAVTRSVHADRKQQIVEFIGDALRVMPGSMLDRGTLQEAQIVSEHGFRLTVSSLSDNELVLVQSDSGTTQRTVYRRQARYPQPSPNDASLVEGDVLLEGIYSYPTPRFLIFGESNPTGMAKLRVGDRAVELAGPRPKEEVEEHEGQRVRVVGAWRNGRIDKVHSIGMLWTKR